jgi:ribosomal protein S18 acetylase RimI-like enzyme
MNKSIDVARQRGCKIMELNTEVDNTVANNLYKSLGFEFKGIMDGYNNYQLVL